METVYGEEDARQVIVDHAREDARVVSIAVPARVGIDTREGVDTFLHTEMKGDAKTLKSNGMQWRRGWDTYPALLLSYHVFSNMLKHRMNTVDFYDRSFFNSFNCSA
jgi:hypothetical protein